MKRSTSVILGVVLLVLVCAGSWYYHRRQPAPATEVPPAAASAPAPASAPASTPVVGEPASAPAVAHPIQVEAAPASASAPPFSVETALTDLFGQKSVLSLFQLSDFPRRVAATVDNLGRSNAPASLWPVNPASGRFAVQSVDGGSVVSADNGLRYTPYVLLIETVDMRQLAATYTRLYPLFQRAYQDIGYPKGYFNDRLVAVIDQMLATPEFDAPLKVHLPTINGPLQPQRPWVLYEFDDPALQSLTAGQKLLLRMGPVNERRVKTKLSEFRRLVTTAPAR